MRLHEVAAAVARAGSGTEGVATLAQLRACGVTDGGLARALALGSVHRLGRNVYGAEPLPAWPEHALRDGVLDPAFLVHARARVLQAGRGARLTARSAALVWGFDMLVEPDVVDIAVDHVRQVTGARRARRLRGVLGSLPDGMRTPIPMLSADQTVVSCAVGLPLVEAVALADSALRSGEVSAASLAAELEVVSGSVQRAAVQRVLALVDSRAESVLESALRVGLVQAGARGLEPQHVVRSTRGHVLRVDLAFPAARLAVETDGRRWHQDATKDQRTDNALAACGWRVQRFGWRDVVHDGAATVRLVLDAVAS